MKTPKTVPVAFSEADMKRRNKRAVVMAWGLVIVVVLFFITTIVRLGSTVGDRVI